jgi:hypothetical protein
MHALWGIRTHDPSVRASEENWCLRTRGFCDRHTCDCTSQTTIRMTHYVFSSKPDFQMSAELHSVILMPQFLNSIPLLLISYPGRLVTRNSTDSNESESESESELLYDWRFTANQFISVSSPLRPTTRDSSFQLNRCGNTPYVTSSLTRRWAQLKRKITDRGSQGAWRQDELT